jgi:hypothetical protein
VEFGYLGAEGMIAFGTLIPLGTVFGALTPDGLRGTVTTSAGKAVTALAKAKAARMKERITSVLKRVTEN